MEITIHNYETVLIDYFDGKLNALETAQVILFLEQHPEIKKEFEGMDKMPSIDATYIDVSFQERLKKMSEQAFFHGKTFDEIMIAELEGDCSDEEKVIIIELTEKNSSLKKLRDTLKRTQLKPDKAIVFPNKSSLKRKAPIVFYLTREFTAAAAFLLIVAMLFLIYNNSGKQNPEVEIALQKNENTPAAKVTNRPEQFTSKNLTTASPVLADIKSSAKYHQAVNSKNPKQQALTHTINNVHRTTNLKDTHHSLIAINRIPIRQLPAHSANNIAQLHIAKIDAPQKNIAIAQIQNQEQEYLSISNWMKKKFIEKGKANITESEKPDSNNAIIDPLTLASVGAGILEKTTGKRVSLTRSYRKDGSVSSYTFAAGKFKYERIKK
jgi:hypothetical protein